MKFDKFHISLIVIVALVVLNVWSYSDKIFPIVSRGDVVFVDYTLKLVDGTVVDTSKKEVAETNNIFNTNATYQPVRVVVGSGQLLSDLENSMVGMLAGQTKEVTLIPEKGFGTVRQDLFFTVPTTFFTKQGIQPRQSAYVNTNFGLARILSVSEDGVVLDLNHPLAGRTVVYEITVLSISK